MKLPYSVMYYLVTKDLDWQDADSLPFEVDNIEDWNEVNRKFDEYLEEHGIEILENKLRNCDTDQQWASYRIIFTYEGKHYGFVYRNSEYEGICLPEEVDEYIPKRITTTIYELVR